MKYIISLILAMSLTGCDIIGEWFGFGPDGEVTEEVTEPAEGEQTPVETLEPPVYNTKEPATEGETPTEEPATEGETPTEEPATEEETPTEEPATEGETPTEEPATEEETPTEEPATGTLGE